MANHLANHLADYWTLLLQRLFSSDLKGKAEVNRLAVLQQTAANRRADYAEEKERAALTSDLSLPGAQSSSRKRMEEAEAAHIAALQTWENKQSRQKSR